MVTGGDRGVEGYLPDLPGEGWPHVTLSGMGVGICMYCNCNSIWFNLDCMCVMFSLTCSRRIW